MTRLPLANRYSTEITMKAHNKETTIKEIKPLRIATASVIAVLLFSFFWFASEIEFVLERIVG